MANDAKTKTSFGKNNQPKKRRGKSERTKWIEALKRNDYSEEEFQDEIISQAMDEKSPIALDHILKRISPIPKQVAPYIEFELDEKGTIAEKAEQIIKGIADGQVPPDIGNQLIVSMSAIMNIKDKTEFEDRLRALEDASNED